MLDKIERGRPIDNTTFAVAASSPALSDAYYVPEQ